MTIIAQRELNEKQGGARRDASLSISCSSESERFLQVVLENDRQVDPPALPLDSDVRKVIEDGRHHGSLTSQKHQQGQSQPDDDTQFRSQAI